MLLKSVWGLSSLLCLLPRWGWACPAGCHHPEPGLPLGLDEKGLAGGAA